MVSGASIPQSVALELQPGKLVLNEESQGEESDLHSTVVDKPKRAQLARPR